MPAILTPADYARWLGEEPDPRDLMRPFPSSSDAHVADFDAGQQAGERRPLNYRADRPGD
jgi:putative SOS response-associated peptidase YedK